ncbi:hypothetical protein [Sulfitobacter sp. 1A15106]|uniref:hypothetical protein n=1 Tax=Sulfitobacter sp. 1A15106 TaxID=3368590 RepID=UPI0037465BDA
MSLIDRKAVAAAISLSEYERDFSHGDHDPWDEGWITSRHYQYADAAIETLQPALDQTRYDDRTGWDLRKFGGDVIMDLTHLCVSAVRGDNLKQAQKLSGLRKELEKLYPAANAEIEERWPVARAPEAPADIPAPRLSPDGKEYICNSCGLQWVPGTAPGCSSCEAKWAEVEGSRFITMTYTNWRGETAVREVAPFGDLVWRATEHHPKPQWIMTAWCKDKQAYRDFALADCVFDGASDGRPMPTDLFLVKLGKACDDHYDRSEAIKHWLEGAWDEAMEFLEDPA